MSWRKLQFTLKNSAGGDGGGEWHKHVEKRGRNISGNLSKNRLNTEEVTSYSSNSSSSLDESDVEISKLSKQKIPFKIQKIEKNQTEGEDGGGGWHKHVAKRGRTGSGNQTMNNSKSRLEHTDSDISSSDDDKAEVRQISNRFR